MTSSGISWPRSWMDSARSAVSLFVFRCRALRVEVLARPTQTRSPQA